MKFTISIICFLLIFSNVKAQNFENNFAKFSSEFSQERLYIHFDKNTYTPGETIWFKSYLMNEVFPSNESKTVYIDWTDQDGKLLLRSTSPVVDAGAFGQFEIPEEYAGQYIHIKAYTKWMLNFDTAFLYNKDIKILHKNKKPSKEKEVIKPEISFFPEGGNIIEGISNRIAFKANDQWGRPLKISGIIKNNSGTIIDKIIPQHDGMGYFFIVPKPNETYVANWVDENKQSHSSPLPQIKNNGVTIRVDVLPNKRTFQISTPQENNSINTVHVLGTMYGESIFKLEKTFTDGIIQGVIPTNDLPTGILTITVFDNLWNPLAERITYINNEEYRFSPEITVQHWGLNKRSKNEIVISVPNELTTNLSISITDFEINADTSENIISHLLLTGDLKGAVYNPTYYFQNNSDSISKNLDLVMLTHGWRRFNWEGIVKGEFPKIDYQRDTNFLSLSGKIFGLTPTELRKAGQIVLLVTQPEKGNKYYNAPIAENGSFIEPNLILFDTARVYYQIPNLNTNTSPSVQFMQNRLPAFTNNTKAGGFFYNFNSDTSGNHRQSYLSDAIMQQLKIEKDKMLDEVIIKRKSKTALQIMDEKYTSGLFSGGDAFQFDLLTDPFAAASLDIFSYLQGKVAGLQIAGSPPTVKYRNATPEFFVNEIPTDISMVSNIAVTDIAYIKVIRPPFIGSTGGGAGGAIAIYLRKGGDQNNASGKSLSNNTVTGYTAIKEFYSPDYSALKSDDYKKDLRTTLYWNPEIITLPGSNKVLLTFYNNDISNGFRIVIEGVSKDGKLTHVEKIME
jgi:hypothetical protein